MKKFPYIIAILCIALLFPAAAFPQEAKSKNTTLGIISVPLANVHGEPLPKSGLVTQVLMADEVRILEKQDYRYRIAIPGQDDREGWIQQEAVSIPKDKGRHYLNAERQWIVIAVPKTEALILDKTGNHKVPLYAGTFLPVLEKNPDGFTVQFPDRSIAIIDSADAMPVKPSDPVINDSTPEEIASTAKKFLGVRYLAGGLTAQGMDIRGLIHIVYRIHGYPIGTDDASFQANAEHVSKKELQPGDILIFHGESEGLFLGNGRFLHAAKRNSIQLVGIYDRRYANALQYGLRIIGSSPDEKKIMAEMTADEILLAQARTSRLPLGKRISYWASRFIGTHYDADPLGLYVRTNRIIADEKVDCMYHTFRAVELARSSTPAGAIEQALSLRFITEGKIVDGLVTNYDERFQYGEDMVFSNKWGKNMTTELGTPRTIPGARGRDTVDILPKSVLATRTFQKKLQDGDIIYWVKDPKRRAADEIVAHLSIVRIKSGKPYLIHAAGSKEKEGSPGGGVVKEVPFSDYVHSMRFIGAFVTRFEQ
ncbi:MAG TPA: NlpC/P60 family protein [Nitrospirota bacterium]|nr:NlpC/P60 family protein [Nitrospirota bacterium]